MEAYEYKSRLEEIITANEYAREVDNAKKNAEAMPKDVIIIICFSGRGDKDVAAIARYKGVKIDE